MHLIFMAELGDIAPLFDFQACCVPGGVEMTVTTGTDDQNLCTVATYEARCFLRMHDSRTQRRWGVRPVCFLLDGDGWACETL